MNFFRCICTRKSDFGLPWGTSLSALGPGVKIPVHAERQAAASDPPLCAGLCPRRCPRLCPWLLRGVARARAPAPGAQSVPVKKNGRTGGRPSPAGDPPWRPGGRAPERPALSRRRRDGRRPGGPSGRSANRRRAARSRAGGGRAGRRTGGGAKAGAGRSPRGCSLCPATHRGGASPGLG